MFLNNACVSTEIKYEPKGKPSCIQTKCIQRVCRKADKIPLLSIRLKKTCPRGTLWPQSFKLWNRYDSTIRWLIVLNPILIGPEWHDVDCFSMAQYDEKATGYTGGVVLDCGYMTQTRIEEDIDQLFHIFKVHSKG